MQDSQGIDTDLPSKTRRKSPKGEQRRREIIEAAVSIFGRDGFQNASIASIASEVGLSLPGLLHYFPTKVDLLLAMLEQRDRESLKLLGSTEPNWRDFLAALRALNRRNAKIPEVVRAFSILNAESLVEDHPAAAWFARRTEEVHRQLAGRLAKARDAGEISASIDPDHLTSEIVAVMDGLQVSWLRSNGAVDMVGIFDAYLDRLLATIETH